MRDGSASPGSGVPGGGRSEACENSRPTEKGIVPSVLDPNYTGLLGAACLAWERIRVV